MIDEKLKKDVVRDVVMLRFVGVNVVLVHGGGPEINDLLNKVGKEAKFVNGLRCTDKETMDFVQMVLCGKVNKDLVNLIQQEGVSSLGICGLDGNLIKAKKISDENFDYGFVGEIEEINAELIDDVIEKGYIPVVSTVAAGEQGEVLNVNADLAAAKIAVALKAEKLILLTNVPGVMKNCDGEESLVSVLKIDELEDLKGSVITGGMIPKVDCCRDAVLSGVSNAHIIDGRVSHSILTEVLSDEGIGTMILK